MTNPSTARAAFVALATEKAAMVEAKARAETKIARLRSLIEAAPAAQDRLRAAVIDDSDELAAFACGQGGNRLAGLIAGNDDAGRAAEAAALALPDAEYAMAQADTVLATLDRKLAGATRAVIVEELIEPLGVQYRALALRLFDMADVLAGASRAVQQLGGGEAIAMLDVPIELPRFRLRALMLDVPIELPRFRLRAFPPPGDGIFSPYLRHLPDQRRRGAAAKAVRAQAVRLDADSAAQIELSAEDMHQAEMAQQPAPTIVRTIRERPEDERTLEEILADGNLLGTAGQPLTAPRDMPPVSTRSPAPRERHMRNFGSNE